jgi:hypothetical protein
MKKISFTFIISSLLVFICPLVGEYNFTAPHKFDELGWGAGNNTRGEKCIAIYGTNVYIGAEANGVSGSIQFYRSTNSGTSWETLEEPGWSDSRYPSLSIDEGGRLYITWFYHNATYNGLCKTGALYGDVFQCAGSGNTWIDWYSNLYFAGCPSSQPRELQRETLSYVQARSRSRVQSITRLFSIAHSTLCPGIISITGKILHTITI